MEVWRKVDLRQMREVALVDSDPIVKVTVVLTLDSMLFFT